MRKCEYRNCQIEVEGRLNKKYCCVQHKRIEKKYKQRERKRIIKNDTN